MIRQLQRRISDLAPHAKLLRAPAEDLPFEDDSFDVAVSTLVLCSVDDQPRALRELRRVLRPGGRLLFLEHIRSDEPRLARLQDRMNRINNIVAHCDCNRPTLDSMRAAGFSIQKLEHGTLAKAPPFVRPLVVGVAEADAGSRRSPPNSGRAVGRVVVVDVVERDLAAAPGTRPPR